VRRMRRVAAAAAGGQAEPDKNAQARPAHGRSRRRRGDPRRCASPDRATRSRDARMERGDGRPSAVRNARPARASASPVPGASSALAAGCASGRRLAGRTADPPGPGSRPRPNVGRMVGPHGPPRGPATYFDSPGLRAGRRRARVQRGGEPAIALPATIRASRWTPSIQSTAPVRSRHRRIGGATLLSVQMAIRSFMVTEPRRAHGARRPIDRPSSCRPIKPPDRQRERVSHRPHACPDRPGRCPRRRRACGAPAGVAGGPSRAAGSGVTVTATPQTAASGDVSIDPSHHRGSVGSMPSVAAALLTWFRMSEPPRRRLRSRPRRPSSPISRGAGAEPGPWGSPKRGVRSTSRARCRPSPGNRSSTGTCASPRGPSGGGWRMPHRLT
jgi:hypothetical protein